MEKELFIRLSLCIDPRKAEAAGLSRKAVESLGIGVPNITAQERQHREALKKKIFAGMRRYTSGTATFPGFGPHPGFPAYVQLEIRIPEKLLKEVANKIVRGCEYVLGEERVVEPPYAVKVYFADPKKVRDVLRLFDRFGPVQLGPGFQVRRAIAREDPKSVIYKIDVWDTWTIYASIMPK